MSMFSAQGSLSSPMDDQSHRNHGHFLPGPRLLLAYVMLYFLYDYHNRNSDTVRYRRSSFENIRSKVSSILIFYNYNPIFFHLSCRLLTYKPTMVKNWRNYVHYAMKKKRKSPEWYFRLRSFRQLFS